MSHLTNAQLLTLKAAILAETDPTFVGYRNANDKVSMANLWFNADSSPAFIVTRSLVNTTEVGKAVNYIAVEAMTDANRARITTFYAMNPVSFQPRADVQTYWNNTFSGALGGEGQATRDALLALWKRTARRIERLYATGTGTTLSPGTLVFEGTIDGGHIGEALEAV
jgi:hypothetical protein